MNAGRVMPGEQRIAACTIDYPVNCLMERRSRGSRRGSAEGERNGYQNQENGIFTAQRACVSVSVRRLEARLLMQFPPRCVTSLRPRGCHHSAKMFTFVSDIVARGDRADGRPA